ncbi:UbiA family prenyltransferase [Niabella insulamsoli]|uniref:UbiA family prenyltransferase n=1 Tax=Niabella insulamsoli TaxID=3144874 RepID=UPI0031FD5D04
MSLLKILRHAEWWEYKLPPLLSIAYATLIINDEPVFNYAPHILLILLSLVVGAAYVSIINDITDIDDDLAAGKTNRMAAVAPQKRWIFPALALLIGLLFLIFFYGQDRLSSLFYLIPWISFSLYSFRPIRLKNRGFLGVLADASGSHIFTSLLMVSSVSYISGHPVIYPWLLLVAVWALCYGLRGILWHQFHDRDNDIRSGIETFATKRSPQSFKTAELLIFGVELIVTLGMLVLVNKTIVYLAAIAYFILVLMRLRRLRLFPLVIIEPKRPYQILMLDFMQVFFPVALLVYAAITQPKGWIVLLIHLALFPFKTIQVLKDYKRALLGQSGL